MRHRFQSLLDLARLPWFEIREGRLAVSDRSIGPTIDIHTHLALTFVLRRGPDLVRAPRPMEHYLPASRPLDLDVYANRNIPAEDLRRLKLDLSVLGFTRRGMRATHTADNLAREMGELGISHSVLLAIDFPAWLSRNTESYLAAVRGRSEFIVFGSVHPLESDPERELDRMVAAGVRGIKVHPAAQVVSPRHPAAMRLYRLAGRRGLPVLWHCGPVDIETRLGRRLSQVVLYEKAIAQNPGVTFILGHSGALQMEKALAYAKSYPNVYLEISCQSASHVQRIVEEAPPDRVLFGSDWPFYHQAIPLAKVLLATEGAPDRRAGILRENAMRLLGIARNPSPRVGRESQRGPLAVLGHVGGVPR